jgi:hypothetical protein
MQGEGFEPQFTDKKGFCLFFPEHFLTIYISNMTIPSFDDL